MDVKTCLKHYQRCSLLQAPSPKSTHWKSTWIWI
uniref:Uncharacterized protein n=1 Tax=Siphoviridae sp. ctGkF2 TaxID=2827823 RepID=A0A8S5TLG8_9CAUD|nr:MAG TPA: hypothetical protein [Siphoviridae sp. ctGkF2]